MDKREELIKLSSGFTDEVKNLTAGTEVEQWLNKKYGPGSDLYERLAYLIKAGIEEGWAANIEIDGQRYRRSRICEPSAETNHFSITAVFMDSGSKDPSRAEEVYRGQYHAHPYGEINMVVPLNEGAQLMGPNGWCGSGWTAPAPGSHHYPEAKGGSLIALFYLPAGRISYDIEPPEDQGAVAV